MSNISLRRRSGRLPLRSAAEPATLPTLFGAGYGLCRIRRSSFVFSFVGQTLAIAVFLVSARFVPAHRHEIRQQVIGIVTDVSPYILPPSASKAGGGGGGGDRDKLQASKGMLPRFSREQLVPPAIVVRNENPKLAVDPTVVVPPEIQLPIPHTGPLGDPGSGGGVGSGHGPGVGPGWGGGIGGGVYHIGGGVSAPRLIYGPEPEFSDEARKAKYQGTLVLQVVVGPEGRTHDIRVAQSLGMGLDEKAIEAIRQWKFEPSRKDGVAVAVLVDIEVNFHLF
jgi:periplasmic protein TonB